MPVRHEDLPRRASTSGARLIATAKSVGRQLSATLTNLQRRLQPPFAASPYLAVTVERSPRDLEKQQDSPATGTQWDRDVIGPQTHPIAGVVVRVAWLRIVLDSLLAVWLCSLPALLIWVSIKPGLVKVYGPCSPDPLELRPMLFLLSLATILLLALIHYRSSRAKLGRAAATPLNAFGSQIEPNRLFQRVRGVRGAAFFAVQFVHIFAGVALIVSSARDGLIAVLVHDPWSFCTNPNWSRLDFPSMDAAVSVLPFAAAVLPALPAVAFVAFYAAMTPYLSKRSRSRNRATADSGQTIANVQGQELTAWIHRSLSPAAQRRVLEDQNLRIAGSWPYHSTYAIIVWLARASVLFPNRPSSNSAVSDSERDDYGLRFHEQGAFYRVVYGPLLAPWFGLMVAPTLVFSYFQSHVANVPKTVLLPSIIVWLAWSVQLAATAASAEGLYAMTIQRNALSRSQSALWASYPGTEFLRRAVTRHTWPGLTASMNVLVAILFAALLGWYGAH